MHTGKTVTKFIVIAFVLWRLFLFIPLYTGDQILSHRPGYEYTRIWKFVAEYFPVNNVLLYPWANFDGVHYLLIAGEGYTNNLGFFPLFPSTIRTVAEIFGGENAFGIVYFFSGLLLANLFFLTGLFVFYFLLRLDYPKRVGLTAIVFLLIFPTSFFFASIYSESLFFLLAISSLYFARKRKWWLASAAALLASLTRVVGVAILPAIILEFILQEKKNITLPKLLPLLLMPLGIIGYIFYNFEKTGDALYFLHAHGRLGNGRAIDTIISIPQTLFRYGKIITTLPASQFEWWIALLEVSMFFFASILLYLSWRKGIRRSYIVFALLSFLIPILSGTFSGLPRYVLILFPMFITLALIRNKLVRTFYFTISLILLFIILMFFSKGYFIA